VLDGIGGSVSPRSLLTLRRGGTLVLYGHYAALCNGRRSLMAEAALYACAGATVLATALPIGRSVRSCQIARLAARRPEWFRADLTTLFALLRAGVIEPLVSVRLPLARARHTSASGRAAVTARRCCCHNAHGRVYVAISVETVAPRAVIVGVVVST
jgi:NADPH:quinone reductase